MLLFFQFKWIRCDMPPGLFKLPLMLKRVKVRQVLVASADRCFFLRRQTPPKTQPKAARPWFLFQTSLLPFKIKCKALLWQLKPPHLVKQRLSQRRSKESLWIGVQFFLPAWKPELGFNKIRPPEVKVSPVTWDASSNGDLMHVWQIKLRTTAVCAH